MVRNRNAHGNPPQANYASRINMTQKELMVEFLENHPEMINNGLGSTTTDRRRLWKELTAILNADGLGAIKTIDGWRDSWSEIKSYVKKKAAMIVSTIDSSGEKLTKGYLLHPLEERISALIWESRTSVNSFRTAGSENFDMLTETDSSQMNSEQCSGESVHHDDICTTIVSEIQHSPTRNAICDGGNMSADTDLTGDDDDVVLIPEYVSVKMEMPDVILTTTSPMEEIVPDKGSSNSRKRTLPPAEAELESDLVTDVITAEPLRPAKRPLRAIEDLPKTQSTSKPVDVQLRSAVAMERLADSVYQLVEHQRHIFRVQTELEEKRLKLIEERTQTEEKKVSIFQQAVKSFISFFKK